MKRNCDRLSDSLDTPIGDEGKVVSDFMVSDFDLEEYILVRIEHMPDCGTERFLKSLSEIQRKILELKMEKVSICEIKTKLKLSNKQYEDHMKTIRQNRILNDYLNR